MRHHAVALLRYAHRSLADHFAPRRVGHARLDGVRGIGGVRGSLDANDRASLRFGLQRLALDLVAVAVVRLREIPRVFAPRRPVVIERRLPHHGLYSRIRNRAAEVVRRLDRGLDRPAEAERLLPSALLGCFHLDAELRQLVLLEAEASRVTGV